MALPVLPNPSNFIGVALVINRSRDGPRFVFHYPAHVASAQTRAGSGLDDGDDAKRSDLEFAYNNSNNKYDYEYDEGGDFAGLGDREARSAQPPRPARDDHLITSSGTQIVPWEHVAGFPTKDLESILTPGRAYHKRLFQVSLDPIYCVSYPIYRPENGIWRKKKKDHGAKAKSKASTSSKVMEGDELPPLRALDPDPVRRLVGDEADGDGEGDDELERDGDGDESEATSKGKGKDKDKDDKEDKVSSMTMFNLVFFLNPKKHDVAELVDTMYSQIIRKVNKVYKFCQQRNDFVWKESKKILAMKEKAREERRKMTSLWNEILTTSSLAASMQDVFEAVSQNKIAVLQLDTQEGAVTHSVQVPVPFHISDLPLEVAGHSRDDALGLWVTTANSFVAAAAVDEDDDHGGGGGGANGANGAVAGGVGAADASQPTFLDKNFALLLMEEDKKIVSELQSDPDEATAAMIEFMKHSKPTLSFHQVANQSSLLSLSQVRKFAHHFIFWRRAIAIPPLHARDVYILSPNCDPSKLARASVEFARAFVFAPALTNILADLSAAPRPYKSFCPTKPLRGEYMRILVWLMRGGWVTQLCTFAYIVVWPEIIYEVEHALEAEDVAKFKAASAGAASAVAAATTTTAMTTTGVSSPSSMSASASSPAGEQPSSASVVSGPTASISSNSPRPMSRSSSRSSSSSRSRSRGSSSDSDSSQATATAAGGPGSPSRPSHLRLRPQPTPAQQAAEKARLGRVADKAARELAEKASAHARKPVPTRTAHPSINNAPHLAHLSPHIILDPKTATGKESLYLSAIGRRLRERSAIIAASPPGPHGPVHVHPPPHGGHAHGHTSHGYGRGADWATDRGRDGGADVPVGGDPEWDERVAQAWTLFCKYFNGHCALERIALQEDKKRRDVWALLTAMSEHLLCVRHW